MSNTKIFRVTRSGGGLQWEAFYALLQGLNYKCVINDASTHEVIETETKVDNRPEDPFEAFTEAARERRTPKPLLVVNEEELKLRLHRPGVPNENFGRPWDIPPNSPDGLRIRKALASETFKYALREVRTTAGNPLAALLDLLAFASNEGLI